jgi:hypothetical protein
LAYTTPDGVYLYDQRVNTTRQLLAFPFSAAFADDASALGYVDDQDLVRLDIETGELLRIASGDALTFDITSDGRGWGWLGGNGLQYAHSADEAPTSHVAAGFVTDAVGRPLALVVITDDQGRETYTDVQGAFWLTGYKPGQTAVLTAAKDGYRFSPPMVNVSLEADALGVVFQAQLDEIVDEARLNIGMPYSFNRGCENPFEGCGGPFHGFAAGFCTDLILDAYTFGADYPIQWELEQDAKANPEHFYRWRNARNTHDMWRYFSYSGQMHTHQEPYVPGDIVFFDWAGDGEIDHVALVSAVDENARPTMLVDATGVIDMNPSGLAAELTWEPFHERTVRGHARWNGVYQPYVDGFPEGNAVLQMALGSPYVSLRLVDAEGRALSLTEQNIPGGRYMDLVWEEVVGVKNPVREGATRYFAELTGHGTELTPYQFTVQTLQGAVYTSRVIANGVIQPGTVRRLPIDVFYSTSGELNLRVILPERQPKIQGRLRK